MLNDMQKWQVENLARNGGFSDRYIASYVFHCRFEKVTDVQKAAVTRYRAVVEVKLMDWRNGRSVLATQHARAVVKTPVKTRKRA